MANRTKKAEVLLGRQLLATLTDVDDLIESTHNKNRLKELSDTRNKLVKQIGILVDTNLNSASPAYQAATQGLQAASAMIQAALKGMESTAKAITMLAKAADLVAKVAAV